MMEKWRKAVERVVVESEKEGLGIITDIDEVGGIINEHLAPLYQAEKQARQKAEARVSELLHKISTLEDALDFQTEQVTKLENDNRLLARRVEDSNG